MKTVNGATNNRCGRFIFVAAFSLIALGVMLRFTGLNFDRGCHLHPDERFLTMVVTSIEWPESVAEYFSTETSPLNPVNKGHSFYVYGDLPVFAAKAIAQITGTDTYDGFTNTGRILSALADSATIALTFLIGSLLFGYVTGLWAAAFYSLSVLPIQLSHFFTTDPFMNLFMAWSFYFLLRFSKSQGFGHALISGLLAGMALACKISAISLLPVAALACLVTGQRMSATKRVLFLLVILFSSFLTFRLLNPYAFDGPSFWGILPAKSFISNMKELSRISQPFSGFPPSLQWALRAPLLFGLKNMALWGTGVTLFISGVTGLVIVFARLLKDKEQELALPLVFIASLLALVACHPVQTMRYFLPLYPFIAIFAAYFVCRFNTEVKKVPLAWLPLSATVFFTLFWALAFHSIYSRPMTRVEASVWIKQNVPSGSTIATELWDDSLPLGGYGRRHLKFQALDMTSKDSPEKIKEMVSRLDEADYLVISSNRAYGPITRLENVFPATSRLYYLLFGNLSGFHLEKEFFSYPSLGPVIFPDDDAEEAFTVYDHPRVFVFKKGKDFSIKRLEEELIHELASFDKRGSSSLHTVPASQIRPVTLSGIKEEEGQEPVLLIRFMFLILMAGAGGMLLSSYLFPGIHLPSRAILLCVAAFSFCFQQKFLPIPGRYSVFFTLAILYALALFQMTKRRKVLGGETELVFWLVFIFFLILRMHNPAIFWGERPFDFGILNSVTRSETYPPIDPWFSGSPLFYHAWGQFFMAFLGSLSHVPTSYLYNLGAALVPAMAAELFYWGARHLTSSRLAGVFSVIFILFSGNLSAFFLNPLANCLCFKDFWDASRIIPDTVNEFPFWTSIFADLHGHFINIVFTAIFLAALIIWSRNQAPLKNRAPFLAGLALGAIALTNPWAFPVYCLVLIFFSMTGSLKDATRLLGVAFATALIIVLPFWSSPASRATITFTSKGMRPLHLFIIFGPFMAIYLVWAAMTLKIKKIIPVTLLISGLLLLFFLPYALTALCTVLLFVLYMLLEKPGGSLNLRLSLLMATGLLVLIGTEIFTLSDRMNTVFKFHFEVWILFALVAGVVMAEISKKPGYKSIPFAVCLMFAASTLPTSITSLTAWWKDPKVPGQSLSIDGLRFLDTSSPDMRKLIETLKDVKGQPTIAEAFGPSYGPYARVSSMTGLPAVIGWEYHVYQHGHGWDQIKERERAMGVLYQSRNPHQIARILDHYHIRFMILGTLEKKTYGTESGPWLRAAGLIPFYRSGNEEIWINDK